MSLKAHRERRELLPHTTRFSFGCSVEEARCERGQGGEKSRNERTALRLGSRVLRRNVDAFGHADNDNQGQGPFGSSLRRRMVAAPNNSTAPCSGVRDHLPHPASLRFAYQVRRSLSIPYGGWVLPIRSINRVCTKSQEGISLLTFGKRGGYTSR
jgi:hypothetical protein